jgi:hypothetical protein
MNLPERILGVGMRRRFPARVDQLNLPAGSVDTAPVSEEDIAALPSPARRYLRFMGVVGRPRDWSFRARFVGEFRQRPGQKFMACEAWQYNTSLVPARVYYMLSTSLACCRCSVSMSTGSDRAVCTASFSA